MKFRLFCKTTAITILFALTTGIASAHTTSIGFVAGDNPGEVVFWTGSYHSCGAVNEGVMTLTGVNGTVYGPVDKPFDIPVVCSRPEGLVNGTNNCFWPQDQNLPLDCTLLADPGISGGVEIWQGVVFDGLSPGQYEFTCGNNCGVTADWRSWNDSSATFTVTGAQIGGGAVDAIPVPTLSQIGIILLIALMLFAAFLTRRGYKTN